MEVLAAAVGSIVSCMCNIMAPGSKCDYIRDPTKEIEVLRKKKEELVAKQTDLMTNLGIAVREGKCKEEVQHWLDNFEKFIAGFNGVERKSSTRVIGGLLNCHSRLILGREISILIKDVSDLLEKHDRLSADSLVLVVPTIGLIKPTYRLRGEQVQKKRQEVCDLLMNDEVNKIGVYGMGGVGKTTMMESIQNELINEKNHFDKVAWVTVGKEMDLCKIQLEIGKRYGVDLSDEQDEATRSSLLLEGIRRKGKSLLILDDLWERISLHDIGISSDIDDNRCKIVLTTRSLEVCRKTGCEKTIHIDLLSEEEAWELFRQTINVKLAPEVEKIAEDVAKECSCLPLAIITIGGAMREKADIREWRVALNDLRNSTNHLVNMEEKVIERLMFSYSRLGHDVVKNCFLFCAWYPEDYKINVKELTDGWITTGLIDGKSVGEKLDRGHVILKKLEECSLLERTFFGLKVKMHDLIRDMALGIIKMNPQVIVKAGIQVEDLSYEEAQREDVVTVSFINTRIRQISISPNWRGLTTLFLKQNKSLEHTADGFFVQMVGLQVLVLDGKFELLPESISDLVNLRVLDASGCEHLRKVPSVEKLQLLRVLRLCGTVIEELPQGMEALVNLECLDLQDTMRLRGEISVSLITKWPLLQELLMGVQFKFSVDIVDELVNLIHLETLAIDFTDLSAFNYYIRSPKFENLCSFDLRVGENAYNLLNTYGCDRVVRLRNESHDVSEETVVLPQNTEALEIKEFNEVTRLSQLPCLKDVKELRRCSICRFSAMEYILSSEEEEEASLLSALEYMHIESCPKLITLYKGVPARGTFQVLKTLYIRDCNNLNYLFSAKLFKQLHNLVKLEVWQCSKLEELIHSEEEEETGEDEATTTAGSLKILNVQNCHGLKTLFSNSLVRYFQNLEQVSIFDCDGLEELITHEDNTILLPKLNSLELCKLPALKSIWTGDMVCPSLQVVHVDRCHELKMLPRFSGEYQSPPPALKSIEGARVWWESLEWDHAYLKILYQPFFKPFDYYF